MTKISFKVIIFFLLTIYSNLIVGQKRVLGKPNQYIPKVDYYDRGEEGINIMHNLLPAKSNIEPWVVISDRDNNPVYSKPSKNYQSNTTVDFKDIFYVVEEKDNWIKVVEASVDGLKIANLKRKIGWIPKENLLLWNSGLVSETSKIAKKILIRNNERDIQNRLKSGDESLVKIYTGPATNNREPDEKNFNFYFVLKKNRKSNRYLLSKSSFINEFNAKDDIVGWVDQRRCSEWGTRLCIEPNFEAAAFEERKGNLKFLFRGFSNKVAAIKYAENNDLTQESISDFDLVQFSSNNFTDSILWEDDFSQFSSKYLAKSNPRRFNGAVMRFPIISTSNTSNNFSYYHCLGIYTKEYPFKDKENQLKDSSFNNSWGEIHRLLTEVFIPHYIKGAKYPAVSYSLFLTEYELINHLLTIERLLSGQDMSTYDKKRKVLYEIYSKILLQFSGDAQLRGRKIEDWTRSQIISLMQGVYLSGLQLDIELDFRIGDLFNEKDVSNVDIDWLLKRLMTVEKELNEILRLREDYDFCYKTDESNYFYWLSLDKFF